MNYELAKKLKDAGFPHNWCNEDDCSCLIKRYDLKEMRRYID